MSFTKYLSIGVLLTAASLASAAGIVLPRVPNGSESKIVRKVQPAYPQEAADLGVTGAVDLDVVVAKDGHIESVQVRKGHPLLTPAAIQAVRQWVFQPFLIEGKPARVVTEVSIPFNHPDPAQRKPDTGNPGATF